MQDTTEKLAVKLQQHDFTIEYSTGKSLSLPDAFSRTPAEISVIIGTNFATTKDPWYFRNRDKI